MLTAMACNNIINLRSGIWPPPRWALAPTTTPYHPVTSEMGPWCDNNIINLRSGIWPPPRWTLAPTTTPNDPVNSEMGPCANTINLRSGIWPPPRWALAPTTTPYDPVTSEMGPSVRQHHQPTIWPPPRWALTPTTTAYDQVTSEMGPCANNNSLRSGHLRDGPSRQEQRQQPTICPPPRYGLCALSPTYDMATSEMGSHTNNSNNLRSGHLRDGPSAFIPPPPVLSPVPSSSSLSSREPQLRMGNSPVRFLGQFTTTRRNPTASGSHCTFALTFVICWWLMGWLWMPSDTMESRL